MFFNLDKIKKERKVKDWKGKGKDGREGERNVKVENERF